VTNLKGISW